MSKLSLEELQHVENNAGALKHSGEGVCALVVGIWPLVRKFPKVSSLTTWLVPKLMRDTRYRVSRFAVMVKWYHETLPMSSREFDSRWPHLLVSALSLASILSSPSIGIDPGTGKRTVSGRQLSKAVPIRANRTSPVGTPEFKRVPLDEFTREVERYLHEQ